MRSGHQYILFYLSPQKSIHLIEYSQRELTDWVGRIVDLFDEPGGKFTPSDAW
jgi:hypothetical protein